MDDKERPGVQRVDSKREEGVEKCAEGRDTMAMTQQPCSRRWGLQGEMFWARLCSRKKPTETSDDSPAVRLQHPQSELTKLHFTPQWTRTRPCCETAGSTHSHLGEALLFKPADPSGWIHQPHPNQLLKITYDQYILFDVFIFAIKVEQKWNS